jgi:hypothetical protein
MNRMRVPERMTNSQLKVVVADYATMFSTWSVFEGTALVRQSGPIRQMVWFQALRTGDYRPTHGINAVAVPIVRMLPQVLDVRHRETTLKQHPARWQKMFAAMEQQFRPPIGKPLDIAEVAALCSSEARETTNDLTMMAIPYAWLDKRLEALSCCARMQACPPPTLAPMPEWEAQMKAFGRSLAAAVEAGNAGQFLIEAAEAATMRSESQPTSAG